jgi:energy-coupling factor transport system ATP-binding protein
MIDNVDILLFDEPLANLDPATGKTAIEIIDDIHKNEEKTVLIIEHRLEDVLHREVSRVIVLNDGRIVADMSADELVCSNVLTENGIREPLYITALKYAGVNVNCAMHPGYISTLKVDGARDALKAWQKAIPPDTRRNENPSVLQMEHVSFSYDGVHPVYRTSASICGKGK